MSAGVVVAAVSAASCSRPPQPARRGGRRISECLPRRSRGDNRTEAGRDGARRCLS